MKFTKSIAIWIFCSAIMTPVVQAEADPITLTSSKYFENSNHFTWTLLLSNVGNGEQSALLTEDDLWTSTAQATAGMFSENRYLLLTSQHTCGSDCPHEGITEPKEEIDAPEGNPFNAVLFLSGINKFSGNTLRNVNSLLFANVNGDKVVNPVTHHLQEPVTKAHLDIFSVLYKGNLNFDSVERTWSGQGTFVFGGTHVVPEPTSLTLLGTALIGLVAIRRRKRSVIAAPKEN